MTNINRNRRIAKNTLLLTFRTFVTIIINLYASRVILKTLGVEDFGIYSVVGGIGIMLSFFSSSLLTATQRFINYEMGLKNDKNKKDIFSTALTCHLIIAILLVIIAETVGLWFVKNCLYIPTERMIAAIWTYHFTIAMVFIIIVLTPFNALIVAYEKMNVYAYLSIIEVSLKLIIIFIIQSMTCDKLIMYGLFLFFVYVLVRGFYVFYCIKNFKEFEFILKWNKKYAKKLMSFSGWMTLGTTTDILSGQGVNMLINIFFGPIMNAAFYIAKQVQTGIYTLVSNIIFAVKPQIVQSYSKKDYSYMYNLIFASIKFSYFSVFFISLPIIIQTEYILSLWLIEVPQYTTIFVKLVLIDVLIQASYDSTSSISQASGKIMKYQIIVAISFLSVFCLTLLSFYLGFPVYSAYIIIVIISIFCFIARLIELKISLNFPIRKFLLEVTMRLIFGTFLSIIFPVLFLINTSPSFGRFCGLTIICFLSSLIVFWFIGFSRFEKEYFLKKFMNVIKR